MYPLKIISLLVEQMGLGVKVFEDDELCKSREKSLNPGRFCSMTTGSCQLSHRTKLFDSNNKIREIFRIHPRV